jgi:condensin complex subunit 1
MVQSFTKLMVILLNFLEKAIANKNDEDLLDEDGEIKKKKKKDAEGHTLTDLVKNVLLKFKDLCFGLIFRPLLVKAPGVGRLLYKGIKQCMKDSLAIYEDKLTEEQNSAQHIYLILQELIQLDVIKVYGLQYDLSMLVNDVEICHKTVGSFLIQCSRSRNSKMYELCSSTLVFILKKHCMAKSKLVSESNSVRYYRQFFEFLAPELPEVFHTHLQEFLYLFDSQCHPLRNAAVEILKQIIIHKCGQVNSAEAKDEELGKNTEELRRELLDWILQRTADKSSWCRLTAVTTLHELMVLKMIHSDYVEKVFEKAAKHIKDPTSIVRKKAMVLASEILTFYISTMEFPNEDVIEPELQNIRSRKTEFAKRNEDPSASAAEKDEMTNQILLAMKYEQIFEFYKKTYQIVGALVPQIVSLMFRSSTDSLEAIRLLVKMKSLGYNKVDAHFPKMYTLIWSEDAAITEEIKSSFISLYVNKERKQNACRNICSLLKLCDKSTKICVLRVVKVLFEGAEKNRRLDQKNKTKYVLEEEFIPLFWTYFQEKFENAKNAYEEEDYRLALKVIAEGLFYFPRWFYSIKKQDTIYLMKIYLSKIKKIVDWEVIADICKIISKTKSHFDQNDTTHVLILKSIEEIIYINQGVGDLGWYTATQSFVQAVFDVSKCPEIYIEIFFKKISNFLGHQSELSFDQLATKLSQLIWTSGEVALKLLARIEDVEELLKKKHTDPEKSKKGMAIESGGAAEEPEELDQAMGGFDGVYQSQREILHEIAESKIIYDNVIGAMMPIVRNVVQKIINNKGNLSNGAINTALAHCCTVTLFKFAAISKKFCHESIETVIELIQKDMDSALVVKSLLGLSDLIKRTPQIVEPFSHRLFETLDSPHRSVKKISMIIITHLILNDLLKIKGEIVDIIMKLIDPDIEIRKFTELFLIQLHKKDPMVIHFNLDHKQLASRYLDEVQYK